MHRRQEGFSLLELLLSIVFIGIIVFTGWYIIRANQKSDDASKDFRHQQNTDQVNNDKRNFFYYIVGTKDYLCTKSFPAQCHGEIKAQDVDRKAKLLKVDQGTDFNGTDPAKLYRASEAAPLYASISLYGVKATSIDLLTDQQATDQCLAEVYEKHPESRPQNQKPGRIYLAPACPGVPQ